MRMREDGVYVPDLTDLYNPSGTTAGPAPERPRRAERKRFSTGLVIVTAGTAWAVFELGRIFAAAGLVGLALLAGLAIWLVSAARPRTSNPTTSKESTIVTEPTGLPAGMAVYRLRIFDNNYELLQGRTYVITMDLHSPIAGPRLLDRLAVLIDQALAAGEQARHPRLEVWDSANARKILDVA